MVRLREQESRWHALVAAKSEVERAREELELQLQQVRAQSSVHEPMLMRVLRVPAALLARVCCMCLCRCGVRSTPRLGCNLLHPLFVHELATAVHSPQPAALCMLAPCLACCALHAVFLAPCLICLACCALYAGFLAPCLTCLACCALHAACMFAVMSVMPLHVLCPPSRLFPLTMPPLQQSLHACGPPP